MALVQRVPHDPNAIDIAAIQRREALRIWRCCQEAVVIERGPVWRRWFNRF